MICRAALRDVDLVVVGLQEIEMGTSSVTRAAIKEAIGKGRGSEGTTANGKWWADELLQCLQTHAAAAGVFFTAAFGRARYSAARGSKKRGHSTTTRSRQPVPLATKIASEPTPAIHPCRSPSAPTLEQQRRCEGEGTAALTVAK